jgi:hypothetical protein
MSLDVWLTMEVDTGGSEPHHVELGSWNITHNLNSMAGEAGFYRQLWHGEGVETAGDLIEPLEQGLAAMHKDPDKFKLLNPSNGWGSYDSLVPWVTDLLASCKKHPKAKVEIER